MMKIQEDSLDKEIQYKNIINNLGSTAHQATDRKSSLKASQILSVVNSYNFMEGYKKKNKVAFIGEQFPSELMHALKIITINLEAMSGLLSRSDNLKPFLKLGDENLFSRDICSVLKGEIGLGLANCYPTPEFIVSSTHPCDGYTKLSFILAKLYNKKNYSLDIPSDPNSCTIAYVEEQLKIMIKSIETELNIKLKDEDLIDVVNQSNEAKEYYFKTMDLCMEATLPDVFHELMMIKMVGLWGLKEITSVCKTLYQEALELYKSNNGNPPKKRIILHGQMSFYSDEIIQHLEKDVEVIYFAPLLNYRVMIDPGNPYKSFAERFINYTWNPYLMRDTIVNFSEMFGINGLILQNAWGCRNLIGINNMLRELSKKKKIKVLMIDNDYVDRDKVSFSHVKNRLDAFLEILEL